MTNRTAPLGLLVGLLLAGCAAGPPSDSATSTEISGVPPAEPGTTTYLVVAATSGPAEVGRFTAEPGSVWVIGSCAGGQLVLHVEPVVELPVPCDGAGAVPFMNQLMMRRTTEVAVRVSAGPEVTWNLRVQQ